MTTRPPMRLPGFLAFAAALVMAGGCAAPAPQNLPEGEVGTGQELR
jgi:hypothetical protein